MRVWRQSSLLDSTLANCSSQIVLHATLLQLRPQARASQLVAVQTSRALLNG